MRRAAAIVALLGLAAFVLLQWRRVDPARHLQEVRYPVRCLSCKASGVLGTAEMNTMIARGEVISPPQQMRRFLCRACGQTNLVLDQGRYYELLTNRPAPSHGT